MWKSSGDHLEFILEASGCHVGSFGRHLDIIWESFWWLFGFTLQGILRLSGEYNSWERYVPLFGISRFLFNLLQAHWTRDINNVVGDGDIPESLNRVFMASGFRMPVTEFFVKMYARAYQHWLEGGDAKETSDFVFGFQDVRQAYEQHISEHGVNAMLRAHLRHEMSINDDGPLPVGRISQPIN